MKPLKDHLPELKKIEGFPIGEDEDILALSNPPYYTACPNPYIEDFIKEHGTPYNEETDDYHREPFVEDVSFGKNHPIYTAHTYHTKVPHQAIMKYIEHYTDEGDIIFDGFCGTGMTGVAAQILNRKAILSDLSPFASFLAYNYNYVQKDLSILEETKKLLLQVLSEYRWLYTTKHGNQDGFIDYVIWSDILGCPYCEYEYIFAKEAIGVRNGKKIVKKEYQCPNCSAAISKRISKKILEKKHDEYTDTYIRVQKQTPFKLIYSFNKKKYEKNIDSFDKKLLEKIEKTPIPFWFPTLRMKAGDESRRNDSSGLTHVHHFYTKRNLLLLSVLNKRCHQHSHKSVLVLSSIITTLTSKFVRYNLGNRGNGPLSGTLYISSLNAEANIFNLLNRKIKDFKRAFSSILDSSKSLISCNSCSDLSHIPSNSFDYIFTDPPFGNNLMYSELNYIWEAWLKVITIDKEEAIVNKTQSKKLSEYYSLILKSFIECYRVLKPNRWITVEFHNSKSSVWNSIQEAITKAGFIIANVSILDKKQGSFKQVNSAGSVKSDLVISAYKPSQKFAESFLSQAGENMEIDFVREFLHNLPKEPVMERTDKMLYNKMLSQYIIRGYEISYNANSFYQMLGNYFVEEDGYWFNEDQLSAYRGWKQKMHLEGMDEVQSGQRLLFVSDEKSALVWLYNFISIPKSLGDIHAAFRKIANITDDTLPELKELLSENFIFEEGKYRRPTSNEEKSAINEKRERQLLREFESLLLEAQKSKKKIKQVRKEALSLGFETCYRKKRFTDILTLAKKLDKRILENNAELNDYVEIAEIKVEGL